MTQKRQYTFTASVHPVSGNDYPIRGMIDLSFAPGQRRTIRDARVAVQSILKEIGSEVLDDIRIAKVVSG